MAEEKETEIVKIKTNKGRIITLSVTSNDGHHIEGYDKFNKFVKISMQEIDSLLPYNKLGGTI